jgi:hypothetical protein
MTDQKYSMPTEIEVYINPSKNGKLMRDKNGFIDITEIRRGKRLHNLDNLKKTQKEFLEKIEKEIGEPPIKSGEKRSTWIHEKILERVLRWYDVDEEKVIDKFVRPDSRIIGSYKYDKVEIFVHLESKHVNASKFCNTYNMPMHEWVRLPATQRLAALYCRTELDLENVENPSEHIIKHGLGYDSDDVWIPQLLMPMLAMWCSEEYALFASKIMNMYHTDPLKLAAMAIKESDRQTGMHTVAVLHSTHDKKEHDEIVARLEARVKALNMSHDQINHRNGLLEIDNFRINEQAKPFFALRDEHNISIADLVQDKHLLLDRHKEPLKQKIKDQTIEIGTLKKEAKKAQEEITKRDKEIACMENSHNDELMNLHYDMDNMTDSKRVKKTKTPRKKATRTTKKNSKKEYTCIGIFTKKSWAGNEISFVPGNKSTYKDHKCKGHIQLSTAISEKKINQFVIDNSVSYDEYTVTVRINDSIDVIEAKFCAQFPVHEKKILTGYSVGISDNLCHF